MPWNICWILAHFSVRLIDLDQPCLQFQLFFVHILSRGLLLLGYMFFSLDLTVSLYVCNFQEIYKSRCYRNNLSKFKVFLKLIIFFWFLLLYTWLLLSSWLIFQISSLVQFTIAWAVVQDMLTIRDYCTILLLSFQPWIFFFRYCRILNSVISKL